jgi:hypothetical protein
MRASPVASDAPGYVEVAEFSRRDRAEECVAFLTVVRPPRLAEPRKRA